MKRFKNMLKSQANSKQYRGQKIPKACRTDAKMSKKADREFRTAIEHIQIRGFLYAPVKW